MPLDIAFVTCARLPDLDPDDRLLLRPLEARGVRVTPTVWDDPLVDWDRFDLTVVRSTWDYTERRDQFVAWAHAVPRLVNSADVIEWNTDKRYLVDLAEAGLPVVPTTWISSNVDIDRLPPQGRYVLKPAIGAGSIDAAVFELAEPAGRDAGRRHAEKLLAAGHTVMVQPYIAELDEHGETGVILLRGRFSHGIRKGGMLGSESVEEAGEGLYKEETIVGRMPSDDELALASAAVDAAPAGREALVYARVDMVRGADGRPMIMELELTEPSLFMFTTPGSEERFADAIANVAAAAAATPG